MLDLKKAVQGKIESLGVKAAAKYFDVSIGTISNWSTGKTEPSVLAAQLVADELELGPKPTPDCELVHWEGREVLVLLPVYKSFNPGTHYTLFANYAKYGPHKMGMIQQVRTMIHEARNTLVHKARKIKGWKYVIFCDDDMILPTGDAGHINGLYGGTVPEPSASLVAFSRLMSHPEDKKIVGSLYFGRHRFGPAQCSLGFDTGFERENEKLRRHQYDRLLPVRWIGTGLLRIERSVFDIYQQAIDSGKYPECKPINETLPYGFFNPIRANMGEDVSFGVRCADLGIQSYLDPVLECLHAGDCNWGSGNTQNRPIA